MNPRLTTASGNATGQGKKQTKQQRLEQKIPGLQAVRTCWRGYLPRDLLAGLVLNHFSFPRLRRRWLPAGAHTGRKELIHLLYAALVYDNNQD
jgi:hypothetical protein